MTAHPSDIILSRLMSLHPKVIDLVLDRVWRLLGALGDPHRRLPPVVHIAGTNGKGSTLAMIRAGLEGAGLVAHAYTSPHLARFHERIRVAGELIDEAALAALLGECEAANGRAPITFFEVTTCAAYLAFARTPADATLLEVGMGGRLDATNVIDRPALTVITPVSLDHQAFLGDRLAEIAGEKAGILKAGVACVVGPQDAAALAVIEARAARLGAPLLVHGQHWHTAEERGRMIYQDESGLLDLPLPILPGPHQIANAGAAVAALRHLGGHAVGAEAAAVAITDDGIRSRLRSAGDAAFEAALSRAEWPARMQRLRRGPLPAQAPGVELWLDGGHNPAAGAALAATLARMPTRPTHLICGMLRTKDAGGYLRPLAPHLAGLQAVAIPGEAATLSAAETAAAARGAGIAAVEAASPAAALATIAAGAPDARVLICGSLYLAGSVLRENG